MKDKNIENISNFDLFGIAGKRPAPRAKTRSVRVVDLWAVRPPSRPLNQNAPVGPSSRGGRAYRPHRRRPNPVRAANRTPRDRQGQNRILQCSCRFPKSKCKILQSNWLIFPLEMSGFFRIGEGSKFLRCFLMGFSIFTVFSF